MKVQSGLVKYEPLRGVALSETPSTEKPNKALWIAGALGLGLLAYLYSQKKEYGELGGDEDCGCGG